MTDFFPSDFTWNQSSFTHLEALNFFLIISSDRHPCEYFTILGAHRVNISDMFFRKSLWSMIFTIFHNFMHFLKAEIYLNKNKRPLKLQKWHFFELIHSPKMISRKILVTNMLNFLHCGEQVGRIAKNWHLLCAWVNKFLFLQSRFSHFIAFWQKFREIQKLVSRENDFLRTFNMGMKKLILVHHTCHGWLWRLHDGDFEAIILEMAFRGHDPTWHGFWFSRLSQHFWWTRVFLVSQFLTPKSEVVWGLRFHRKKFHRKIHKVESSYRHYWRAWHNYWSVSQAWCGHWEGWRVLHNHWRISWVWYNLRAVYRAWYSYWGVYRAWYDLQQI